MPLLTLRYSRYTHTVGFMMVNTHPCRTCKYVSVYIQILSWTFKNVKQSGWVLIPWYLENLRQRSKVFSKLP